VLAGVSGGVKTTLSSLWVVVVDTASEWARWERASPPAPEVEKRSVSV
jgi:hypothetical protein